MGVNKTIFVSSEYQILKVDKQENDYFLNIHTVFHRGKLKIPTMTRRIFNLLIRWCINIRQMTLRYQLKVQTMHTQTHPTLSIFYGLVQ